MLIAGNEGWRHGKTWANRRCDTRIDQVLSMDFRKFEMDGPLELTPHRYEDDRGYFAEIFRQDEFQEQAGNSEGHAGTR